jgi:hypothetical protein
MKARAILEALATGPEAQLIVFVFTCCVFVASAGELVWKKPIPAWTTDDARQILADSPWAGRVLAAAARVQSEDARRDGGRMGQPHGPGYDGLGDGTDRVQRLLSGRDKPKLGKTQLIPLLVRWESALPIRIAELKAGTAESLTCSTSEENRYCIAVSGLPGTYSGDPSLLSKTLRRLALLKRAGKKDEPAADAAVYQLESGMTILYSFPATVALSGEDEHVTFFASIGRIQLSHTFNLGDMQLEGKLLL